MKTKTKRQKLPPIIYKNYILERSTPYFVRDRFDIYERRGAKKAKALIGYAYRFEQALDKLVRLELADRKDVVTLKDYCREFNKAKDEIKNLLT